MTPRLGRRATSVVHGPRDHHRPARGPTTRAVLAAVATLCMLVATQARADETPKSYGAEILAVDGVGVLGGLGAYAASSSWRNRAHEPPPVAGYLAVSMYGVGAVGGPAVHWAHGRTGIGFADLGMRLTLPPLSGLVGLSGVCTGRGFKSPCSQTGMTHGVLVGQAIATTIDAAVFASPKDVPPKTTTTWYGWQTLGMDALSLGAAAGLATRPRQAKPNREPSSDLRTTAAGWYVFSLVAGPVVHLAHGKGLRGLGDLGIRVSVPLVAILPGIIGTCGGLGGRPGCVTVGVDGGWMFGMALVAAIDAFVLAKDVVPATAVEEPASVSFIPIVTQTPGGLLVGAAGVF